MKKQYKKEDGTFDRNAYQKDYQKEQRIIDKEKYNKYHREYMRTHKKKFELKKDEILKPIETNWLYMSPEELNKMFKIN